MPEKFKVSVQDYDKDGSIDGPFEALALSFDYDDVDRDTVKAEANKLCKILNEHWNKK
jgi:hypothetical protein